MEINKYQAGKIYAVRSPHTEIFYIGSTINELSIRFRKHKYNLKTSVKELFALGDAYIELIELFPCNSQAELHKREGELIRENRHLVVNKKMAGGREVDIREYKKAYYLANAEKLIAQDKAWREANKERKAATDKAYREANKVELSAYQEAYYLANAEKRKAQDKAWREANKERKAATDKAWREANKERKAATDKAWQEANKDKKAATAKAWQEAHKERKAANNKAYYERKKAANPL